MSFYTSHGLYRDLRAAYANQAVINALHETSRDGDLTEQEDEALDDLLKAYEATGVDYVFNVPTKDNLVAITFTTDLTVAPKNARASYSNTIHSIFPTSPYQASIDNNPDLHKTFNGGQEDPRDTQSLHDILTGDDEYSERNHERLKAIRDDTSPFTERHVISVSHKPYRTAIAYARPHTSTINAGS